MGSLFAVINGPLTVSNTSSVQCTKCLWCQTFYSAVQKLKLIVISLRGLEYFQFTFKQMTLLCHSHMGVNSAALVPHWTKLFYLLISVYTWRKEI